MVPSNVVEGRIVCSCPWEARFRGGRGPCANVLAVEIVADSR